eukprot:gene1340-781_t
MYLLSQFLSISISFFSGWRATVLVYTYALYLITSFKNPLPEQKKKTRTLGPLLYPYSYGSATRFIVYLSTLYTQPLLSPQQDAHPRVTFNNENSSSTVRWVVFCRYFAPISIFFYYSYSAVDVGSHVGSMGGGGWISRQESTMVVEREVNFTWENLTYKVPVEDDNGNIYYKTLLFNLSGCAKGGRVLAIMGPSGAGKTTLMGTITGKLFNATAIQEGCCFMNNNIYQQRYKRLVSYVCQDDIVMGKETPREAITFSARLRLGLDKETAKARVDEVINRLSLTKCQNTILGIPGILKGVSGGEKKRANIGSELVTNPYVMLLDEPTTGLDSVNAVRVGQLLQELAKNDRRTVIATVHSPSSELFDLFDDLLLLAKGHVIYHGPTAESLEYFAALGYRVPPRTNPTEYFMNLLQLPEDILSKLWLAWEDYVVTDAAADNPCLTRISGPITLVDEFLEREYAQKGTSMLNQFFLLMERAWRMYLRDPTSFYGRGLTTLFFALFIGIFYINVKLNMAGVQDRQGSLYLILMANLLVASTNGIASFPAERAVFLQEQANDAYNAYIYYLAKVTAELPWQILFPTIYACVTYFLIHYVREVSAFFISLGIQVVLSNFAYSFGVMFATFFEDYATSFAMIPLVMLPLFLVSGLFASTERLYPYWEWLNYLSFPRLAYVGFFNNEFHRLGTICNPVSLACPYPDGDSVIKHMGFEGWEYWQTFISLIIYWMGITFIGASSLYMQGKARRGKLRFAANLDAQRVLQSPLNSNSNCQGFGQYFFWRGEHSPKSADRFAAGATVEEEDDTDEVVQLCHADEWN